MPRNTINYTNTLIYKLVCDDENVKDIYVGHTTNYTKRKNSHKNCCNNEKCRAYNLKVYRTIRNNGGWENWKMLCIEIYPCNNVYEAISREQHWYSILKAELNSQNPQRNLDDAKQYIKNWLQENIEKHKNTQQKYYEDNKETIIEYKKEWSKQNKERIVEQKQQYYKNNQDIIKSNSKNYYTNNKEQITERRKEKYTCECGGCYTRIGKSQHFKTQKHQKYLLNIQNNDTNNQVQISS